MARGRMNIGNEIIDGKEVHLTFDRVVGFDGIGEQKPQPVIAGFGERHQIDIFSHGIDGYKLAPFSVVHSCRKRLTIFLANLGVMALIVSADV